MDKTYRNEWRRLFLLEGLPAPLVPASGHQQIFDNYLENTRLRLRSVRVPETKEWTFILQQTLINNENAAHLQIAEIHLNEAEHAAFEIFEGREIRKNERVESNEIRKNRYFYESEKYIVEIDVFLGKLWGLTLAQVRFEDKKEFEKSKILPFAIAEVTGNLFFTGENLVGKNFTDVQAEFAKINEKKN